MLELARSSVDDWVQELVTKALSELRVSKHKTRQYARSIIKSAYQEWTHRIGYIKNLSPYWFTKFLAHYNSGAK